MPGLITNMELLQCMHWAKTDTERGQDARDPKPLCYAGWWTAAIWLQHTAMANARCMSSISACHMPKLQETAHPPLHS